MRRVWRWRIRVLSGGTGLQYHVVLPFDFISWWANCCQRAHSVPCFARTRMLLCASNLHSSSHCSTKLCSAWSSQCQSYSMVAGGEKWNLWWKSSKGWGQLGQATNPAGQLFLPASPVLLWQLCHSTGPAVTDLLRLWHCRCPAFPALSICPPVLPFPCRQ